MAWVIPGGAVTGNQIPSSFGNDVIADLTILETNIAVAGTAGAPAAGSNPGVGAPNFQMQVFRANGVLTDSNGRYEVTFGTPFSNGLFLAVAVGTSTVADGIWQNDDGFGANVSACYFQLINTQNAVPLASTVADIRVVAIGF